MEYFVVFISILLIIFNMRMVPMDMCYIVERMGTYHKTWEVGLHFKLPLVDRIVNKVSKTKIVLPVQSYQVKSLDEVVFEIEPRIEFTVKDIVKYTYTLKSSVKLEKIIFKYIQDIFKNATALQLYQEQSLLGDKMKGYLVEEQEKYGIYLDYFLLKIDEVSEYEDARYREY